MIVVGIAVAVLAAWVGVSIVVSRGSAVHRPFTGWEVELARLEMEIALTWREVGRRLIPPIQRLARAYAGIGVATRRAQRTFEDAARVFALAGEALRDELLDEE